MFSCIITEDEAWVHHGDLPTEQKSMKWIVHYQRKAKRNFWKKKKLMATEEIYLL